MTALSAPAALVPEPQVSPDIPAATIAARGLLRALGVNCEDESTAQTPARMARAYAELFSPRPFSATTFANDEGYCQLVVQREIPFTSVCEHHLLPFIGVADIGYLPGERIIGLSKLARVVETFACRPQTQERMTQQIAHWFVEHLGPVGVGVVVRAEHLCMRLRGVHVSGTSTTTSALTGQLLDDATTREEFLALTRTTYRGTW